MFEIFFLVFILRLFNPFQSTLRKRKSGRHSINHIRDAPRISLFLMERRWRGGWGW